MLEQRLVGQSKGVSAILLINKAFERNPAEGEQAKHLASRKVGLFYFREGERTRKAGSQRSGFDIGC